jgi:uncharacterized protein YbaP (TraB family)
MRNTILAFLAAALFSSTCMGQEKGLLYEVTGKDLKQPSYLFGTFHLVCPADLQISPAAQKAMAAAQQLYLEIDFDDPSLAMKMATQMVFTDGRNMKTLLNAEDYALLDKYLTTNLGTGLAFMGMMKPIALLSLLYRTMLQCEVASYDTAFADMAVKSKKEVLGFETVEQQMSFFDKIPLEAQLKVLMDMVRKPAEARAEMTGLMTAYRAQDVTRLMKLIESSEFESEIQGFQEEMLDKRNNAWIPIIEQAARTKPTFFAFGAGHLGGPSGVVNLLRQRGYTVRALQ